MAGRAKTLYHGGLRDMGPVRVTVKAEAQQSKYKGKPDYVHLEINGEEFYYNTENEACANFFDGTKGRTFTLQADGSREEATLVYVGESGNTVGQQAPPRTQQSPPPQRTPPPAQHAPPPGNGGPKLADERALTECKFFVARHGVVCKVALKAASAIAIEFTGTADIGSALQALPEGLFNSIFTCVLYGSNNTKWSDALPLNVDFATLKPVRKHPLAQQAPAPPPPPPPPPAPTPEQYATPAQPEEDDVPF